jgi:hypothetical protein
MNRAEIPPDHHTQGGDRPSRLLGLHHRPAEVARLARQIYDTVLERSESIRAGNFTVIAVRDLHLLFDLTDAAFFGGLLGAFIREDGANLTFRLSSRMTRVGGTTTVLRDRDRGRKAEGPGGWPRARYEITVSTVLLFNTFRHVDRPVTVGGLACRDRLEALQRIFEHELLHLAEFLAWGRSSCSEENFHRLSQQIFGHAGVRHDLVSPRELAAVTYGVRVGDRVSFEHEGMRRVGRVNRITRRATVLVEDPAGEPFSDGKRYATFYVPVALLRKEGAGGPGTVNEEGR